MDGVQSNLLVLLYHWRLFIVAICEGLSDSCQVVEQETTLDSLIPKSIQSAQSHMEETRRISSIKRKSRLLHDRKIQELSRYPYNLP